MVESVTFLSSVGGDGSTVTDDDDPNTGLDNYGYVTRLVPAFSQVVSVAAYTVGRAEEAAASAASALNAPGTNATSTTSLAIGTGSKAFTIQTGKAFSVGQVMVAASAADPNNQMVGVVTAHNSVTGSLTLNVTQTGGSGTKADWVLALSALVSSSLPSQTGNANKFLMTDGTNPSWVAVLKASNNLSDLGSASTARTNLGLGSLATASSINDSNWSGTDLAVTNGGTGSSTAAGARTNLGAAASGANSDITSLSGLTTALSIAQGGTGGATAAAARSNLGLDSMATQSSGAVAITGGSITGVTPIGVAAGGTGSGTAAGARSNLGAASPADITAAVGVFTGAVVAFAVDSAPTGWLECDGAAVSRTTYAALFSVIGTIWGSGDGSTTFNLPDLRGEFIRGWDHGRGVDSGRTFASAQSGQNASHTHTFTLGSNDVGSTLADQGGTGGSDTTQTTASSGGAEARPRNISVLYCIKI